MNFNSYLPYRKDLSYVRVTFHFSSMTDQESGAIHDTLTTSINCPDVNSITKTANGVFQKESLDTNSIVTLLQKKGFSVLPDKLEIEPHEETTLNCLPIVVIVIGLWLLGHFLLK